MDAKFFTILFVAMLAIKSLSQGWLARRNMLHIFKNRNSVPEKFASQISLIEHQKAADYSVQKIKTKQVFHLFDILILLLLTLLGGLELINQLVMKYTENQLLSGLFFYAALGFVNLLASLPKKLYSTFVIEEKHGFNKTTLKIFIKDMLIGALLSIIIGGPILYFTLWIMANAGRNWWIYAFSFLSLIQLLITFIYPQLIAPFFNKFSPLPDGEVKTRIIKLMEKCGFHSSGIFVMDASKRSGHGNAYLTGFGRNKRVVFFDNLLNTLEAEEIEAVMAHELGHMKKYHIIKGLILGFTISFIIFAIFGALKNNIEFHKAHGIQTITDYTSLALFSMVVGLYTFLLTPFFSWNARRFEYQADRFASENAKATKLISALVKTYKHNASSMTPDPVYSRFYFSHPPAIQRVQNLESL